MILPAAVAYALFGTFSIVGGVMGFRKANSRASLIAGVGSGVLLLAASTAVLTGSTTAGLVVGGATSLLLGARFVPAYMKSGTFMPQGIMAGLSTASLAATVLARLA
jgi:uncharacterized membrane protein (UPF0136 family)